MTIARANEVNIGIIAVADKATFRNLKVNAHKIEGSYYVGNLIGRTLSPTFITESETNSSLKLEGDTNVGGIAGSFQGLIANTKNKSDIKAEENRRFARHNKW